MNSTFIETTHLDVSAKLYTQGNATWHKFSNVFPFQDEWTSAKGYYGVVCDAHGDWWLWRKPGFRWDGASGGYPDYDWIMEGSAVHDCLHWLIRFGVLPETCNHLIDKELEDCIRAATIPWWKGGVFTRYVRARIIRRATNTCNERRGSSREHAYRRIRI